MAMSCHDDDPLPSVRFQSDDPAEPPLPRSVSAFLRGTNGTPHGAFPVAELSFLVMT
jgi:hypothetical protein